MTAPLHLLAAALITVPAAADPDTTDTFKFPFDLSGGIYLYHYAPLSLDGASGKSEVYALFLNVDRDLGALGLHVQARARDTRLRPFYPSVIWFQEAFGYYESPIGTLKAGKLYTRLGRFWDNSFFGNLHYFDGLKLDPDFGIALEGERHLGTRWSTAYSLQYFTFSDGINGALNGRDVESAQADREKDTWVARIVPRLHLSPELSFALGGNYANGRIDREVGGNTVESWAIDAELTWGTLLVYGEYLKRTGRAASSPPQLPQSGTDDVRYWLAGGEYTAGRLTLRYNYSRADYRGTNVVEEIHQPGVAFALDPDFIILVELDYWETAGRVFDRSLNGILLITF